MIDGTDKILNKNINNILFFLFVFVCFNKFRTLGLFESLHTTEQIVYNFLEILYWRSNRWFLVFLVWYIFFITTFFYNIFVLLYASRMFN